MNEKMFIERNQIHNFMSSFGSGTVINYGSGSDFLTSYGSGSGSTSQKITVPTVPVPVPVPVPQHWAQAMGPVGFICYLTQAKHENFTKNLWSALLCRIRISKDPDPT